MLLWMYATYPQELRADFQEYYGLNIDDAGKAFPLSHASDLAAKLPQTSRTFIALDPSLAWSLTDRLLVRLIYATEINVWAKTKDAKHKRNMPQMIQIPKSEYAQSESDYASMTPDEFEQYTQKVRKEARNGRHDNT